MLGVHLMHLISMLIICKDDNHMSVKLFNSQKSICKWIFSSMHIWSLS